QATRLIQRVGRSGHRIGRTARGVIITMDSDDTLEAMAIARMAVEERLEPVIVPDKPYDALSHQIVGLLMKKTRWRFSEIHDICKNAYPYAKLTEDDIRKVLTYMHQRFPRFAWVSFEDHLVIKPRRTKAMYEYYFENLSMIPAEKKYLVIDENSDGAIGVLDEAFVAEYGKPGVKFIIRGTPWKISNVMGDHLYVKADDDPTGAIPSWVGEEIPVPFIVAQEVGQIRGRIETEIAAGAKLEDIAVRLTKDYPADRDTIVRALEDTADQVHRGLPVPTDHRVLVEDWEDFVIIHGNFGSLANRALAQLIGHVLSDELGTGVAVQHDPYRIFVQTGGQVDADRITSLFGRLSQLSEGAVRDLLTKSAVRTGIFKRRMVHVARRFGALQRWVDFSRVSLSRLMKSFEGTAIFDEALKEVFTKDLNLERLVRILNEVRNSEITIIKLKVDGEASPIARVGIEKASMKTDLIQPERMRRILLESTRVRLLNETRTFVCCSCWDYLEMLRVKGLPAHPSCPRCSSRRLGVLRVEERQVLPLVDKDEGEKLTKAEAKIQRKAVKTAALVERFGLPAVVVLCGRGLRVNDAEQVLKQEKTISDTLFDLIIEAERNALKRRFW
ncbi:MAG: ATP-dependent helicase, partial [Candidatus Bathyarchaeota archaeon]